MTKRTLRTLVAVSLLTGVASAQAVDSPETVIRSFVLAMYSNDTAAYERLTVPFPGRERLERGGSVNVEAKEEVEQNPEAVQIRLMRPYQLRGREVSRDASGDYPIGTTARFEASYRNSMIVSLVRRQEGWRIDVRWWLAMLDLATGQPPGPDSPEYTARALIASLVALDRDAAARLTTPGGSLEMLFAGAPREPEPSDVLPSLTLEMPLVEIGPGEFCQMPSGRIVEGVKRDDMKVLVGLFGPLEMPFVVQRFGTAWKVQPEPYFSLILQ